MDKNITCAGLTYLFDLYMKLYCKKHKISEKEFLELDRKYKIFEYIEECEDSFGNMSDNDGIKYIERHIEGQKR